MRKLILPALIAVAFSIPHGAQDHQASRPAPSSSRQEGCCRVLQRAGFHFDQRQVIPFRIHCGSERPGSPGRLFLSPWRNTVAVHVKECG